MVTDRLIGVGRGLSAPARLLLAASLLAAGSAAGAQAQRPAPAQPAQAQSAAIPDPVVILKLIWSAMAALDHANKTGNYSVLRDLAAPGFQSMHSPATLAEVFGGVRASRVDLGNALVVTPNYDFAPAIVDGGLLRVRGNFPLRPQGIAFDLLFQNVSGEWRVFGIAVAPESQQARQSPPPR